MNRHWTEVAVLGLLTCLVLIASSLIVVNPTTSNLLLAMFAFLLFVCWLLWTQQIRRPIRVLAIAATISAVAWMASLIRFPPVPA